MELFYKLTMTILACIKKKHKWEKIETECS